MKSYICQKPQQFDCGLANKYLPHCHKLFFLDLSGLPDLKDSSWVLLQQRKMINALAEMGFDGFRIDAIKHLTERMIEFHNHNVVHGQSMTILSETDTILVFRRGNVSRAKNHFAFSDR